MGRTKENESQKVVTSTSLSAPRDPSLCLLLSSASSMTWSHEKRWNRFNDVKKILRREELTGEREGLIERCKGRADEERRVIIMASPEKKELKRKERRDANVRKFNFSVDLRSNHNHKIQSREKKERIQDSSYLTVLRFFFRTSVAQSSLSFTCKQETHVWEKLLPGFSFWSNGLMREAWGQE